MKLEVTLTLICVLFPKVLALQCHQCISGLPGTCRNTKTECPDQCVNRAVTVNTGDQEHEVRLQGCSAPGECLTGSVNLGFSRTTFSSYCCSTDLCNAFPWLGFQPPLQSQSQSLGKKCYTCNKKDCKGTVRCEFGEDHCITATAMFPGARLTLKGCASRDICSAPASILQEAEIIGNVSCCLGNLCNRAKGFYENLYNSAKRIKQSLLIMVPLIPSILFQ
ncbi:hypothetical protein MHYP_G00085520 [Metynnis hypsauchen]